MTLRFMDIPRNEGVAIPNMTGSAGSVVVQEKPLSEACSMVIQTQRTQLRSSDHNFRARDAVIACAVSVPVLLPAVPAYIRVHVHVAVPATAANTATISLPGGTREVSCLPFSISLTFAIPNFSDS